MQANQQESLILHRDIAASMAKLGVDDQHLEEAKLADNLPLFPEPPGSEEYLGDPKLLGKATQFEIKERRSLPNTFLPHQTFFKFSI